MDDDANVSERIVAEAGDDRPMRIGLVATDSLRVLGLQEMLGTRFAEIVPLSVPGVLEDATLSIVFVDASCTEHLLELLTTFRKMRPRIRLIVIGNSTEPEYIQQVIGAGARGYVTQGAREDEIRMALKMVNDGSVWAPRKVLARLLDASGPFGLAQSKIVFTARELEVLTLLIKGLGNREIGRNLGIDEGTVKAHVSRLMRKVGVKNRVELTLYALPRLPL